jgi:3-methyladenine DNA glycosylase AlkC
MHAAQRAPALRLLRVKVSHDPAWQVQEILAMAFDRYCHDCGYEAALPLIDDWLADRNPNSRRAVSEGLRIWTARPYFKDHPAEAIERLSALKADDSDYVRRSAGNALRDISRKHKDLVAGTLADWDLSDTRIRQTHQLASKFLN